MITEQLTLAILLFYAFGCVASERYCRAAFFIVLFHLPIWIFWQPLTDHVTTTIGTNMFLYYVAWDCLCVFAFILWCCRNGAEPGEDEHKLIYWSLTPKVILNLIFHVAIQTDYSIKAEFGPVYITIRNFIWDNYIDMFALCQVWMIGYLFYKLCARWGSYANQ